MVCQKLQVGKVNFAFLRAMIIRCFSCITQSYVPIQNKFIQCHHEDFQFIKAFGWPCGTIIEFKCATVDPFKDFH